MGAYTASGALRTSNAAFDAKAIVTSDTTINAFSDVRSGDGGDVTVVTAKNWADHIGKGAAVVPVLFTAVAAGERLGVSVAKVMATGTTSADLVGLLI